MSEMRGVGDRWLAGQEVPGVLFAHHDLVEVTAGPHAGASGTIALLIGLSPEPTYLVSLGTGGDLRARQSFLRPLLTPDR
jgi:hypothetical protein